MISEIILRHIYYDYVFYFNKFLKMVFISKKYLVYSWKTQKGVN